ncbi:REI1, pre-60S factor REI1 [Babesia microti strain RI]|uniref:REI1, pre-60S factor REI1 n=1 Tax=Babesia microti (strain RI) TaxID=1133968 RepID=I7IFR8_BABMR|nr:REI1, pre-60S factor REI1 [Babesia microti strain RI]CCF73016.1 REI1, pre-60S factor REI1 [Babesia microti strain RI]|eukprot:XP_012647625.1 REI1, pre-60S factor REI1 [Babesia microti strain RI]
MSGTISFSKGLADISALDSNKSTSDISTRRFSDNGITEVSEKKLCTTCNEYIEAANFRGHFKCEWHRYNMYRKQKQLSPIDFDMFLEREEMAKQQALIVKQKGQDHIKHKVHSCPLDLNSRNDTTLHSDLDENVVKKKGTKNRVNAIKYCAGMSIFNAKFIGNPNDALNFMIKHNGFYLPEAEYISNLAGLLEYLGNIVFIGNECLYCGRIFSTLYAVWHHMEAKGHQKIPYEMIEEIYQFYDFTPSYAKLLKNRGDLVNVAGSDINFTSVDGDIDDEWEDISDIDGYDEQIIKPEYNEPQILKIYSKYNLRPAMIDENNNLTLPDGREVVNRSTAYVYKQHLRPIRMFSGALLMSKSANNRICKEDFKGKISWLRDKIRQNIHKDVRSYKLFKVRSQNIIFK